MILGHFFWFKKSQCGNHAQLLCTIPNKIVKNHAMYQENTKAALFLLQRRQHLKDLLEGGQPSGDL
jgi:hypothetical protein